QGVFHPAWRVENGRMRNDSQETAQHDIRHSIGLFAIDEVLYPIPHGFVMNRIGAVGVNENVHVDQNHFCRSIKSEKAALSSRSTPARGPLPFTVVSRTRSRRAFVLFGVRD